MPHSSVETLPLEKQAKPKSKSGNGFLSTKSEREWRAQVLNSYHLSLLKEEPSGCGSS